jgi:hypothetical protein
MGRQMAAEFLFIVRCYSDTNVVQIPTASHFRTCPKSLTRINIDAVNQCIPGAQLHHPILRLRLGAFR